MLSTALAVTMTTATSTSPTRNRLSTSRSWSAYDARSRCSGSPGVAVVVAVLFAARLFPGAWADAISAACGAAGDLSGAAALCGVFRDRHADPCQSHAAGDRCPGLPATWCVGRRTVGAQSYGALMPDRLPARIRSAVLARLRTGELV